MRAIKHIASFSFGRFLAIIAFALPLLVVTSDSYAAMATLQSCAQSGGFPPEALTGPIVYCVQQAVQNAVVDSLSTLESYFRTTIMAAMVLAAIIHGAHMLSGERGMNSKAMVAMLKIACVGYFALNMDVFAGKMFGIMGELLGYATAGSPWTLIDNILGTVFGFAPGVVLSQGLMWLAVAMTNGTASAGMSVALVVALVELVLFFIEIVYTYLSAYIVVAFMLILSPMFIPMLLFQASDRYFRKWLDVIIGAMLIPMMVFATVGFSLQLFSAPICKVINTVLPNYNCSIPLNRNNLPDFSQFWKIDIADHSFTMGVDPNFTAATDSLLSGSSTPGDLKDRPGGSLTLNPFNRGGFDTNFMHPPSVNFGKHDKTITQKMMFALISLWLYTMIVKQLIEAMPEVAQEIAGVAIGITLRGPKLNDKINEIKSDIVGGAGMGAGAFAGARIAAPVAGAKATEAAAVAGGIIGHVLARKAL